MKIARASTAIFAAAFIAPFAAKATPGAAREVCKQFIEHSGYVVSDWGQYWNWTTIDNKDGTWSVGARVVGMPPGGGLRNMYLSCVAQKKGDNWRLLTLSRLM